jgi:hypothetical protein
MQKIHVILQSKDDYDNEQRNDLILFLRFIWWVCVSAAITFILTSAIRVSPTITCFVFLGFLALCFYRSQVAHGTIRAYISIFFGLFYLCMALGFLWIGVSSYQADSDAAAIGLVLAAVSFYLAYNEINKHTNLLQIILNR